MLLLLLSRFGCVRLCATPETAAHQAPPSLGFSRQEHWSRLPFPSLTHENEKWKWSFSVMSDSLRPHGLQPTWLLCPWDFPGKSTGVGCHCLLHVWGMRKDEKFITLVYLQWKDDRFYTLLYPTQNDKHFLSLRLASPPAGLLETPLLRLQPRTTGSECAL